MEPLACYLSTSAFTSAISAEGVPEEQASPSTFWTGPSENVWRHKWRLKRPRVGSKVPWPRPDVGA